MLRTPIRLTAGLGVAWLSIAAVLAQPNPPPLPPGVKSGAPAQPPAEQGRRDPPPLPQGLEVQARGPVHEAFAEPATQPIASPVVSRQPPTPVEELPPEEKPAG